MLIPGKFSTLIDILRSQLTIIFVRHGILTLFAALNYLEGKLITTISEQHRHQEWLVFLKKIERETPKDLDIHLIVDNYATHKHSEVNA